MTWKTVTTVTLGCGHKAYYRGASAPKIGHIVLCAYCRLGTIVKTRTITKRTYPPKPPPPPDLAPR